MRSTTVVRTLLSLIPFVPSFSYPAASTVSDAIVFVDAFKTRDGHLDSQYSHIFTQEILQAKLFKNVVERENLDNVMEAREGEESLNGGHRSFRDTMSFLRADMMVSGTLGRHGAYWTLTVDVVNLHTSVLAASVTDSLPAEDAGLVASRTVIRTMVIRAFAMTRKEDLSAPLDSNRILLLEVRAPDLDAQECKRLTTVLAAKVGAQTSRGIVLPKQARDTLPDEFVDILSPDFDYRIFDETKKRKLLAAREALRCSTMLKVTVDHPTLYQLRGSIQELELDNSNLLSTETVSLKRSKYGNDDLIEQLVRANRKLPVPQEPSHLLTLNFGILWPYSFTNPEQRHRLSQEYAGDSTIHLNAAFADENQFDVFLEYARNLHPVYNPVFVFGYIPFATDTSIVTENVTEAGVQAEDHAWFAQNGGILFGGVGMRANAVDWSRFRLRADMALLVGYKWERQILKSESMGQSQAPPIEGVYLGKTILYRSTLETTELGGFVLGGNAQICAEVRIRDRLSLAFSAGILSLFAHRMRGTSTSETNETSASVLGGVQKKILHEKGKKSLVRADFGYGSITVLQDPDQPLKNSKGETIPFSETFQENTFFPVRIGLTYEL